MPCRTWTNLVARVWEPERLIVIDGYHGFTAVPTDLSAIQAQAFYLAGGYKYAMAGEGACFLHAPPGIGQRPRDTGWFADFGALESETAGSIGYAPAGARFMGATFDPVGLYRLRAALSWLEDSGLTVAARRAHCHGLQEWFIGELAALKLESLRPDQLMVPLDEPSRGHFLTFRTPVARDLQARLQARKVITDARGERLRFGFGVYHDEADVARLCRVLSETLG